MTVHAPEHPWPKDCTRKERCILARTMTQAVKAEIRRLALDDSDMGAANLLTFDHLNCCITQGEISWQDIEDKKPLELVPHLEYDIRIRRKFQANAPILRKTDVLALPQIAAIIKKMSPALRQIAADCLCWDFLQDYRESMDLLGDADDPLDMENARELLEDESPGELRRLYEEIRNGIMGKSAVATPRT